MRIFRQLGGALLGAVIALPAVRAGDTVIVYDASNSMWGRIGGEAKVTIAREVMGDVVADWDEGAPVGLVAYGHRREGDCSDIETVVPVGPVDRASFTARINALSPKGKTPLTDALRHAAEELKYRDAPATVVLVSDGIESCGADPCAAATELNEAGINFTAHVIGFDVGDADQAQLKCIADNTGGQFFAARDAESLKSALGEAAAEATRTVPEAKVTVTAPESAVAGSRVEVAWQGEKIQPRDLVTIVPADAPANARGEYERVGEQSSVILTAPGETGGFEARYVASATGRAVASAPVTLTEPRVDLAVPETATAGAAFPVRWTGTVHPRDYVTIVPADAPSDAYEAYFRVGDNSEDSLQAPAEAGAYEVRYLLAAGGGAVAAAPVEVVEQAVSVTAPGTVTGGTAFEVQWNAPVHPRDYVTIVPADAPASEYGEYERVGSGTKARLTAPTAAGDYEVRYLLQESDEAVARAPVRVTGAETSVSAPESVTAGSAFTVSWTNVMHPRDYVTIVPADAPDGEYGEYERVGSGTEARLPAPAEAGAYEVRYLLQKSDQAIARTPVRVTKAETSVSAPGRVTGGQSFRVSWTNVIHHRDYVTIVPAGAPADAYGEYERVGNGTEASLPAPAETGDYEVRYLMQQGDKAIARAPVKVVAPEVQVSGPASATAGSRVRVSWDNVIHPRDKITIVPADAPAGADGEYERVGSGREATLEAPASPGDHEIRYLLNVSGQAIARAPITLTRPQVSLSAPDSARAGSRITVQWGEAVHHRDKITIVPADAPAGADGDYERVGGGSETALEVPGEPGPYEVRYLLQARGEAIARRALEVRE